MKDPKEGLHKPSKNGRLRKNFKKVTEISSLF